jgi:hypothetical protein
MSPLTGLGVKWDDGNYKHDAPPGLNSNCLLLKKGGAAFASRAALLTGRPVLPVTVAPADFSVVTGGSARGTRWTR